MPGTKNRNERVSHPASRKAYSLVGLYTWCGLHPAIVKPAVEMGRVAIFGSSADFCSAQVAGRRTCERVIVKSKPIYEKLQETK